MKYINNFIKYRTIYNEINAIDDWQPNGRVITNKKKIAKLKKLDEIELDIYKYLYTNFALRENFWIWNIMDNKSLELYHSVDQWIEDNRESYYREILVDLQEIQPFSLNDRDEFLRLFPMAGYKMWSMFYPFIKELLLSLDDMDYFKKIVRSNMILKMMGTKGFYKLKEKAECLILKE